MFRIGQILLGHNIAHLCYSQGVLIPGAKLHNFIPNILQCFKSPQIGLLLTEYHVEHLPKATFPVDLDKIVGSISKAVSHAHGGAGLQYGDEGWDLIDIFRIVNERSSVPRPR